MLLKHDLAVGLWVLHGKVGYGRGCGWRNLAGVGCWLVLCLRVKRCAPVELQLAVVGGAWFVLFAALLAADLLAAALVWLGGCGEWAHVCGLVLCVGGGAGGVGCVGWCFCCGSGVLFLLLLRQYEAGKCQQVGVNVGVGWQAALWFACAPRFAFACAYQVGYAACLGCGLQVAQGIAYDVD